MVSVLKARKQSFALLFYSDFSPVRPMTQLLPLANIHKAQEIEYGSGRLLL
jgi:hypothetical protein